MGISTAINNSLLPQSLIAIQNFLKQDAEQRKQEEKRQRVNETAGEITKMFSTLPDNATVEQINNVSKQAMMLAFKQDAQESMNVIDPLSKMALGELGQREQLKQSAVVSKFLGIKDQDIAKLPVQTMVDAMKLSESMVKDYDMKNALGQTIHRRVGLNGQVLSEVVLDPTTTAQKISQELQLKTAEAEAQAKASWDAWHPTQSEWVPERQTSDMRTVMYNRFSGEEKLGNYQIDNKALANIKLSSLHQEVNERAMDLIGKAMAVDPGIADELQKRQQSEKNQFDPTTFLSEQYAKGNMKKAESKGYITEKEQYDYWDAKHSRDNTLKEINQNISATVENKSPKGGKGKTQHLGNGW